MRSFDSDFEHIEYSRMKNMKFFMTDLTFCPPHFHNEFEIVQAIEGTVHILANDRPFQLRPGEIALFNPYESHALHSLCDTCVLLVVQLNAAFCGQHYPQLKNTRFTTSDVTAVMPETICQQTTALCFDLGCQYYAQEKGYELRCLSELYRLLWYLVTYVPNQVISDKALQKQTALQKRLSGILQYIQERYTEKLTLAEIAQRECLSVTYLSHLFKDNLNISFQQYVNKLRLDNAVFLLSSTDMSILDVCLSSGFSDPKYLNRLFDQSFGVTPKEFRQRKQRGDLQTRERMSLRGKNQTIYTPEQGIQILRRHSGLSLGEEN